MLRDLMASLQTQLRPLGYVICYCCTGMGLVMLIVKYVRGFVTVRYVYVVAQGYGPCSACFAK